MVTVTDKAAAKLREMKSVLPENGQTLRLVMQEADGLLNIGLAPDQEKEGDQIVESEGEKVLLVDPITSDILDGTRIDVVDTPQGEQLSIGPGEEGE